MKNAFLDTFLVLSCLHSTLLTDLINDIYQYINTFKFSLFFARLTEYESCSRLNHTLLSQLNVRDGKQYSTPDYNRLTSSIQVGIKQFDREIQQLNFALNEASKSNSMWVILQNFEKMIKWYYGNTEVLNKLGSLNPWNCAKTYFSGKMRKSVDFLKFFSILGNRCYNIFTAL